MGWEKIRDFNFFRQDSVLDALLGLDSKRDIRNDKETVEAVS